MVPRPNRPGDRTPAETHYVLLGIPEDASLAQIQRAWREKALKHHPDRDGETANFLHVREAHDTLKDGEKRQAYDRKLAEIPQTIELATQRCSEMLQELDSAAKTVKDAFDEVKGVLGEIERFSRRRDKCGGRCDYFYAGRETQRRKRARESGNSAEIFNGVERPVRESRKCPREDEIRWRNEEDQGLTYKNLRIWE